MGTAMTLQYTRFKDEIGEKVTMLGRTDSGVIVKPDNGARKEIPIKTWKHYQPLYDYEALKRNRDAKFHKRWKKRITEKDITLFTKDKDGKHQKQEIIMIQKLPGWSKTKFQWKGARAPIKWI